MTTATIPPKEHFFEQEIIRRLRTIAYQDPDKVADGLSYIWGEQHKWHVIASKMGQNEATVRTQLKLIVDRRNKIVHEADVDILSGVKFTLTKAESDSIVDFIESCGEEIAKLVG